MKSHYWMFILYPESAPSEWLNLLADEMVEAAVSPCHDSDLDKQGKIKKPHYHILLHYDGSTTYNHVLELTRRYNATIPIKPESPRGAFEYLTHKNDLDKFQYKEEDLLILNGFKPPRELKKREDNIMKKMEICSFVRENQITEFSALINALLDLDDSDSMQIVMKNAYFYRSYIESLRYGVK